MEEILRLFPDDLRQAVMKRVKNNWNSVQEIRIRVNKPIEILFDEQNEWLTERILNKKDAKFIVNQLSEFSLYRMTDELREGYITIDGGHRVGIAGKVNTENGIVKALQHITFFNIRIAKQKIGVAEEVIPFIYKNDYMNTLIIGPPQTGKTTLIRDLARLISTGWEGKRGQKVSIIDERSEIAASIKGVPQHDVGPRTDVLDACPKAEGMMMMIRSMSPEVLIVDEIGSRRDIDALMEAIHSGVIVICTIHGQSLSELKKRPSLQLLFNQQVFERVIQLERNKRPGSNLTIYDGAKNIFLRKRGLGNEMDRSTYIN